MKYKYRALISAPYFQPIAERFRDQFEKEGVEMVIPAVHERLSERELLGVIGDIDAMLCGDDKVTRKVIESAPKLKVISKWGTGMDSLDHEAAKEHGIAIKNTVNAFTEPVADSVMGFILCFARDIVNLNNEMKEGVWTKKITVALNECALGIVGLGNVGKAIKKRAESFGMKVLACDIKPVAPDLVSLEELLAKSDFVSLNCDLNTTSRHLINKNTLAMMKPTAFLINTSRGPVVKETDLVEALEQKKIAGAALDVFEDEPLPDDSPLRNMRNVILSPHNANASPKAWNFVHQNTVNNLISALKSSSK